jgi:hypothetical protein
MYNPDIIGTESWLKDINSVESLELTLQCSEEIGLPVVVVVVGGGVSSVKNVITCTELWVDEEAKMIAVEVKGTDQKYSWEIKGLYRAPNEDMFAIEKLVAHTQLTRHVAKGSIVG